LSASFFLFVAASAALAAFTSTLITKSSCFCARRFCSSAAAFDLAAAAAAFLACLAWAASFASLSEAALAAALAALI
jgi:hypothetical protein